MAGAVEWSVHDRAHNAPWRRADIVGDAGYRCICLQRSCDTGTAGCRLALSAVACFSWSAPRGRLIFVAVGLAQTVWALSVREDGFAAVGTAIARGGLIIALFTALAAIRAAASSSEDTMATGRFLARQPPGRRYAALTIGGHLFGLVLMYRAISLLGTLASQSTAALRDAELRQIRLRRMLIAIQRGFAATLCWSPLAFSMVLATSLVPGATWSGAVLPCLFSAIMMQGAGWVLDTLFKPRVNVPTPARAMEHGKWLPHLRQMLILLTLLVVAVGLLQSAADAGVVPSVMLIVPSWLYSGPCSNFGRKVGPWRPALQAGFAPLRLPTCLSSRPRSCCCSWLRSSAIWAHTCWRRSWLDQGRSLLSCRRQ